MDYLWSPWRYRYVTTADAAPECVFCNIASENKDVENLVVWRGQHNFILLNRYPYTSGHLMVVPYAHAATLEELPDATLTEQALLLRDCEKHLRTIYRPEGLNIGLNIGKCAGAGIAGHVHAHIMPRWTGDSSFMTVVGETRVLPEELEETRRRVSAAFRGAAGLTSR